MKRRRIQRLASEPQRWLPHAVLAGALLVTYLAALYVHRTAVAKDRVGFENSVQQMTKAIDSRLDTYVALLRAGAGLFAASKAVEADEFRRFVKQIDLATHYPGIQGMGFSARVPRAEKNALIEQMHRSGYPGFKIWPEGDRAEYHTILDLEPLTDRNRIAIGYDMSTEPVRRAAMERARDTGSPTASGRVTLVQDLADPKQAGFLIYVPVYVNGAQINSVEDRRAALTGFVYSPFRARDLLSNIPTVREHRGIDFEIFDRSGSDPSALLYDSATNSKPGSGASRFGATTQIYVADRPWTLRFNTNDDFEAGSATNLATLTLVGGGFLSFLLFATTRLQTRAQSKARSATRELWHSEKVLRKSVQARQHAQQAQRETEERYWELFENASDIVYALDLKGNLTSVNKAGEAMTGYRREELIGKSMRDFVAADSMAVMREMLQRKIDGQTRTNYEIDLVAKDGQRRTLEVSSRLIQENGQPVGIQGIARDITERKVAEENLRVANKRAIVEYEHLLARIAALGQALGAAHELQPIYRALRDFVTVSVPCNGLFVSLYDPDHDVRIAVYGWGDGIELDVSQLPPMPVTTDGPNSRAVRNGKVIITEDYMKTTSGHPQVIVGPENGLRPESSMAVPMTVMGKIIGTIEVQSYSRGVYKEAQATAMSMAANLTAVAIENARLLSRESQARTEAEESNRLKDEFLATVSHELRTPLTAILGWARMLDSGTLESNQAQRAIQTIQRNAKAQAEIVDDILDVSRIITGNLYLNLEPTELVPVIEAAINVVRPTAEAKHIQIETSFEVQPALISGDPNRLQQIIWNVLANAIKFTDAGGNVRVRTYQTGAYINLEVSDDGQGISAEFLPHVFERFRQADSSTTRRHGGLGLGLAIVRHLVEIHGGSVRVRSEGEGKGATFTVTLPLLADESLTAIPVAHPRIDLKLPEGPELVGLHVLVVDDDVGTREVISAALNERRARVTAVSSAQEALTEIRRSRPDVLVSDIAMPVEDGYKLIEQVRALSSEKKRPIPAIAITAYAREEDRNRALAAGYQSYLPKPIEPAELVAVVAQLATASNGTRT